jgi:DNA-directed RNA polymerase II subunit RPB11
MNAPERFRSFLLDDGEPRMTYAPDQRIQSAGTFSINKEDHTIGNLLRMQILRDTNCRFVGYMLPHPLVHVCNVKVETEKEATPVAVFGQAVGDLRGEVELLDRGFRDECARAREEADVSK